MSGRYCYDLWQSSLNELQSLLNESSDASQDKDQLAKSYLRYLQVLKQLDEVYTYIRQPQHREAVGTALLCCAGLVTEAWSALVTANKGIDVIDFDSYLLKLGLTPDDLEVPIPKVLTASERVGQAKLKAAVAAAEDSKPQATNISAPEEPDVENSNHSPKVPTPCLNVSIPNTLPLAASVESDSSPNAAATKIQSAWRGWRDRRNAADEKLQQLEYLGMSGNANLTTDSTSSVDLEDAAAARQQRRIKEYEQAKLEIEELLQVQETPLMVLDERNQVNSWLEEKIKSEGERWPEVPLEGDLLLAAAQGTLNSSGVRNLENQNPKGQSTKQKPLPSSSKVVEFSSPAGKARKIGAGSGGASVASNANAAHATSTSHTLPTFASQLEGLIKKWKVNGEKNLAFQEDQADGWNIDAETAIVHSDTAKATIRASEEPHLPALNGLPLPRRGSSIDAIDLQLLTAATRPRIKERIRLNVRQQARQIASAAHAAQPAPPVPKQKQTSAGPKSAKFSMPAVKKLEVKPTTAASTKSGKPGNRSGEPKEPKREPLPPLRDLEEIYKELAQNRIAVKCPDINFADFIGMCCLVRGSATGDVQSTPVKKAKSGGKAATTALKTSEPLVLYPELSFAQIRQLLTVKCALPLAIYGINSADQNEFKKPHSNCCPVTALLYGPQGSGKTMLVNAIAHESKASLFNLSPKTLVGKYSGQQNIDVLIQSVFAAAKAAAPAVICIDDAEQIFIRDEKRAAQLAEEIGGGSVEPMGRIRRQLLAEIAALKPEDRVLVLCTTREPHACVSADEASFISFFQFIVNIPLPDDRCRRAVLHKLASELKGEEIWTAQKISLAAQLTQGYTVGALKSIMTRSTDLFQSSKEGNRNILDCFIDATAVEMKIDSGKLQAVAEWTARAHAMLGKTTAAPPLK